MLPPDIADNVNEAPSENPQGFPNIDSLPTEIQDLIFHHVVADSTREELKLFRRSNRYFRDRSDLFLFSTLHISASKLSLERVRHVSENDRLNAHVKELIFHRGTFSGHKMVKFGGGTHMQPRDYDDFEDYLVRSRYPQRYIMQASKCYHAFREEVEAEALFNQDLESTYLRRRCALTHQSATPNYFAPYEIVEPCGPHFRPKALRLEGVNGEDFASIMTSIRGGPQAIRERFSELRSFRLSFSETVTSLELESTYEHFVPACISLQNLSLDFTSFYSPKMLKDAESFPQKLVKLVLQQSFSRLVCLDLTYPLMTEHEFISFLCRHQSTLTSLKLHRWPMPVTTERQPTGSMIRTFQKIGQLPMHSLHTVRLTGEFSNRSDGEGWVMDGHHSYDKTVYPFPAYAKLIRYLEDRGDNRASGVVEYGFPIPISEGVMNDAKTGGALLALDRLPYELGYSDPTFTWWEDKRHC